jgi:hypothetical protein
MTEATAVRRGDVVIVHPDPAEGNGMRREKPRPFQFQELIVVRGVCSIPALDTSDYHPLFIPMKHNGQTELTGSNFPPRTIP